MGEASRFKTIALEALKGKWKPAVLTGFVAALLGGAGGGSVSSNNTTDTLREQVQFGSLPDPIRSVLVALIIVVLLLALVGLVIGGATWLGYATFNLNLIDGKDAKLKDLFCHYDRLGSGFLLMLLHGVYITLWTLLLVIPGIVKSYSYAMAPYLLAENPGMGANEAITDSGKMMKGHRWRLFDLHLGFLGWALLSATPMVLGTLLVLGPAQNNLAALLWLIPFAIPTFIGNLFLRPYREAATAAFYRDLAGRQEIPLHAMDCDTME